MADKQFDGYLALARQQIIQNNPGLALETLKEAAKIEPSHAVVHQLFAAAHYNYFQHTRKRPHLRAAKESVETAIRLAPNSAHSFYLQALILQNYRWNRAKAKEAIAHALKLDPDNPDYLIEAGSLNRKKYIWNKDKSYGYFKRALELAPADPDILAEMANHHYFLKNERAVAEAYAREALKFDPQNVTALLVMGHIFYKQRQYEHARENAILVLSQNPRNYDALVLICLLESRRNILIGSSYRFSLWLQKPVPAILVVTICLLTRTGFIVILYLGLARMALRQRVKKYVADIQLNKNF